jgi:pre-rRNA-processing protein TSR1
MARHGGGGGSTQKHKAHKGGRKRQNKAGGAGGERQGIKSQSQAAGRKGNNRDGAKRKRQQRAQDHRHKLRAKSLEEKRQATKGPPKIVATVPVCDDVDVSEVWNLLIETARGVEPTESSLGNRMDVAATNINTSSSEQAEAGCSSHMSSTFYVPDVKVRLTFLPPFDRNESADSSSAAAAAGRKGMLIRLLDYVRIADVVLFVTKSSSGEVLDPLALSMCQVMRAFSLPNVYACVQGFHGLSLSDKAKLKKRTIKVFTEQVKDSVSCFPLDSKQDCLHLFRTVKEHKQIVPIWRKQRPYLVADKVEITPTPTKGNNNEQLCNVNLVGFIRGQNLSVNQVVLLPGVGEYHMDRILQEKDPIAKARMMAKHKTTTSHEQMEEDVKTLAVASADPSQLESLVRENIPDPLAGEQTWPTEEEMREAEEMQLAATKGQTITKNVPKGFSEYQSAWIGSDDEFDSDEMEFEDSTDEEDENERFKASYGTASGQRERGSAVLGDGNDMNEIMPVHGDFDDDNTMKMDQEEEEGDELDMEKYAENYKRERKARKAAEDDDMEFPDEVDVPMDKPARERFVKYRGLKSFRTSPWDPKESLPREYAKIFAFENPVKAHKLAKTRLKSVVGRTKEGLVVKGEYVKLVFTNVPEEKANALAQHFSATNQSNTPYVIFGLLQHETKMSLMNFSVHKAASYQEPLANKDELTFYTGIRTFKARPIISDAAPNVDKHKNQRFIRGGERCIFSVYAPIHHPPLPLLCFKEKETNEMVESDGSGRACQLVSSGLVDSVDPDRVVLKRIILTGYPHKVHKSKAYVRYMFHDPRDVKWFSPLELWTKWGRRGKIREAVGTHGTMKCMFDAVVQQRDTICLSLYKRVFPKWPEKEDFNS